MLAEMRRRRPRWSRWLLDPVGRAGRGDRLGQVRRQAVDEGDRAGHRLQPFGERRAHPRRLARRGSPSGSGRPIQRSIAPMKSAPAQAHELVHRLLDAGRMADRGQIVGDLPVAGIFALDQHAVEVEDDGIELHARSPNRAVPTRTWVAPIITARLIVGRHAHAEAGDVMTPRQLGEQGEIGRRLDAVGRKAHQPGDRQPRLARQFDQRRQVGDRAAAFLRLVADIDLEEAVGPPAALRHRLGERGDQRRPVDRMDRRRTGRPRPRPCWTGAGRRDGGARPDVRRAAPAIWPAPPGPGSRRNRAGRRRSAASIASAGWVLETAIRVDLVRPAPGQPGGAGDAGPDLLEPFADASLIAAAIGRAMLRRQTSAAPLADDRRAARRRPAAPRSSGCRGAPASSFATTACRSPSGARCSTGSRRRPGAGACCCCSPGPTGRRAPGAPTAATAAGAGAGLRSAPVHDLRRNPRRRARRRRPCCSCRRSIATRSHPDARAARPGALRRARAADPAAGDRARRHERGAGARSFRRWALTAGRESTPGQARRLEAEGGADVDGLAVAALVARHRLEPVAGDAVAGAGGDVDVAGDREGAADVERIGLVVRAPAAGRLRRARRRPRPGRSGGGWRDSSSRPRPLRGGRA